MRSIRARFILLILIGFISCAFIIGGISAHNIARLENHSCAQTMNLLCTNQAQELDEELLNVEQSVEIVAGLAVEELDSEKNLTDVSYREEYLEHMDPIIRHVAQNTKGARCYYFRFAPELGDEEAGFFYSREADGAPYVEEVLTDLSKYDRDDVEHVGWYYQPVDAGKALWMEPYYNKNIGVYMISYVIPIYTDDALVGIVGMDIDFQIIEKEVSNIRIYESGYAVLVDDDGKIYYHPALEVGDNALESDKVTTDASLDLSAEGSGETLMSYTYEGVGKQLAFRTLHNGMKLLVTAKDQEIHRNIRGQIRGIIAGFVLVALVLVLITTFITGRITKPLTKLTVAARRIAEGNLDVELPAAKNDEVGNLTESIASMTEYLKTYISDINSKVYRDPLTGVRNKTACVVKMEELNKKMDAGDLSFGLCVMDLNGLKTVNDECGHAMGDEYLKACCYLICHVFQHSPVYRIGGDEFLAVLEGHDLAHRFELVDQMEKKINESMTNTEPWKRLSVAKGIACCRKEDGAVDDVFRRADEAMYHDKKRMKAEER